MKMYIRVCMGIKEVCISGVGGKNEEMIGRCGRRKRGE